MPPGPPRPGSGRTRRWVVSSGCLVGTLLAAPLRAADEPAPLTQLSLEQLMDIEVISASKTPMRLVEAASAVQVVRSEDIQRSGYQTLAEALRLAPNLQVAQVNASQWAISARGFNNVLANKLLVLIDGRSVYTPFYAGVFWDVQQVVLEDVERVEVTSGPGGTLWGANAVNGIINVITKDAEATQGLYVSGGAGTAMEDMGTVRYGGRLADDLFFRVYGQHFDQQETVKDSDGAGAGDDWRMTQGGARVDWKPGVHRVTLQGDAYDGNPDPEGFEDADGLPHPDDVDVKGANVIGRWSAPLSDTSDFRLQAYYDWASRDFNNGFADELHTYDIDWQHHFRLDHIHDLTWGMGYRLMDDHVSNLPAFAVEPGHERLHLYSGFVQDQLTIVPDTLILIVGAKVEHNDYTGFEYQPNGRIAWMITQDMTVWGSVARAVRTPARLDRDFRVMLTPTIPLIQSNDNYESERVIAYELGWRGQVGGIAYSLAGFINDYDDLRSAEPGPPPFGVPLTFGNGVHGQTHGVELSLETRLAEWWRVRGGYTFLHKDLSVKPGSQDLNDASVESNDPESQALLQSFVDLPWGVRFDAVARYVSELPDPHVSDYIELDLRVAWFPARWLELAVVGENLLDSEHVEFSPESPSTRAIERSVYGSATVRW